MMSKSCRILRHLSNGLSRGGGGGGGGSGLRPANFNHKSPFQWKPISLLFGSSPISSLSSPSLLTSCTSHDTTTTPTKATAAAAAESSAAYLSVRIRCRKDVADMLSEALLSFGASSTSMDEQDHSDTSNEIYIDSIFPESEDVGMCLSQAADSIGLEETLAYEVKLGEEYDWVRKSQESFEPIELTKGLWIVPEWRSPPDAQATNVILNPGLAFGTGEHPTTKMCLLLLKGLIKGGETFLDYGTGSGVLAVAALKFGASLSVGFDVDPQALESARYNAALNDIGHDKLKTCLIPSKTCSPLLDQRTDEAEKEQSSYGTQAIHETEKYDVVIANILLNPLLELADRIVSHAKPGGVVGISGIITEQLPYIMDRYSVLLEDVSVSEMDNWVCLSGRKKSCSSEHRKSSNVVETISPRSTCSNKNLNNKKMKILRRKNDRLT